MPAKITFKPTGPEFRQPGNCTSNRQWDILRDGVVVGAIESCIRDLNQDFSNPGYSVTVSAGIDGVMKTYRKYSGTFSNRSMREAKENRSSYVNGAKAWARQVERVLAELVGEHSDEAVIA